MKNYYAILEVPVGCSLEEIRQAYHRLVQEHLDDEAVFSDLKEAYEVLTTPSRRADYDRAAWGETFESPSSSASSNLGGTPVLGRCPMGVEAQCPVLSGRSAMTDKFCPECGYLLASLSSSPAFDLSVLPDPSQQVWLEDRNGQTHLLKIGTNIVGRENADVIVPDKTVSRNHAHLELNAAGGVTVEDMSSTNGTQVNDELLPANVLRNLTAGDRLRFGSVYLVLHLPDPNAPAPDVAAAAHPTSTLPSAAGAQVTEMRESNGRSYPLVPGFTTFGRRAENTVVLNDDLYVSGSHAQIRADGEVFILTDIGSTNGTLLNGERLQTNTPVTLDTGDVIVIGGTALRFERLDLNSAEEAGDVLEADKTDETETADTETAETEIADSAQNAETAPAEIDAEDAPSHAEG